MTLGIDSRVTVSNSEGTVISPKVVPAVNNDPMIDSITYYFNCVASKSFSGNVFVDTRFVVQEIFIDGEGGGDGPVSGEVFFDVVNTGQSVTGCGFVFIVGVIGTVSGGAGFVAFWGDLCNICACGKGRGDMVGAFFHGVRETTGFISKVSSSNNSGSVEPAPGSSDLTSIASL